MELRNLVTFVKIVENGSFTRTAESLGYSQSAVTMQIKQLESELGTPLFERIGKIYQYELRKYDFLFRSFDYDRFVGSNRV